MVKTRNCTGEIGAVSTGRRSLIPITRKIKKEMQIQMDIQLVDELLELWEEVVHLQSLQQQLQTEVYLLFRQQVLEKGQQLQEEMYQQFVLQLVQQHVQQVLDRDQTLKVRMFLTFIMLLVFFIGLIGFMVEKSTAISDRPAVHIFWMLLLIVIACGAHLRLDRRLLSLFLAFSPR